MRARSRQKSGHPMVRPSRRRVSRHPRPHPSERFRLSSTLPALPCSAPKMRLGECDNHTAKSRMADTSGGIISLSGHRPPPCYRQHPAEWAFNSPSCKNRKYRCAGWNKNIRRLATPAGFEAATTCLSIASTAARTKSSSRASKRFRSMTSAYPRPWSWCAPSRGR